MLLKLQNQYKKLDQVFLLISTLDQKRVSKRGSLVPGWKLAHPLRKGQLQAAAMLHPLKKGKKNFLKKKRQQPLKKGNSLKKEMLPKRWQFWSQRLPPTSRQNPWQKGRRLQPLKKGQKRSSPLKPNQNLWLCWLIGTIA